MTQTIISSGRCNHCMDDGVPVLFLDGTAIKTTLCIKCLVTSANMLYEGMDSDKEVQGEWRISSLVSYHTGGPMITIEAPGLDMPVQMTAQNGEELALNILEASEAAKMDASLVGALKKMGFDRSQQAVMLYEVREYRNANNDFEE